MKDILQIPTKNLEFATIDSWKKVAKWLRQRPITGSGNVAAKTGNNYLSGTMTDKIEILTASLGFSTMPSSKNCPQAIATTYDRQPQIFAFGLSVVVAITWKHFYRARHGRKSSEICSWHFDSVIVYTVE